MRPLSDYLSDYQRRRVLAAKLPPQDWHRYPPKGHPDYNPKTDAPAVWHDGAEFIEANRYYHVRRGVWMDDMGSLLDPEDCPECGGALRVKVELPRQKGKEWLPSYKLAWCTRCAKAQIAAGLDPNWGTNYTPLIATEKKGRKP